MSNPEVKLLNHVINTGDIVSPLNSGIDKAFVLYSDEWEFIKQYYKDYREVVPKSIFFDKFPGIAEEQTDGVMEFYIEELFKWSARHHLQEILTESASTMKEVGPYAVMQKMTRRLAQLGRDTKMIRDIDLVSNADERMEALREKIELRRSGRSTIGVPTGISAIDNHFGGCMKGDFIVIAAPTGQLKSWLALYMALNAWKEGYRVLYFSLEMSGEQLGYRIDTLLGEGLFSNTALTFGTEDVTYDHYKVWLGEVMRDKHPFVVVSNEDLDEINQDTVLSKIIQWKPDLCIIDYHGLLDEASGITGEVEKTKTLSKAFKRMAIKTGVPIIDIAAVTQDKKDIGEKPAELHELAWSRQLGYDSDLCLSLCLHGETLQAEAVKVRRGKKFGFWLEWNIDRGIVKELGKFKPQEDDK